MAIGLIIIGDEILSGKRTDQHFPKVVQMLKQRGLQLSWAEYVGDEPARLVALLKRSFASGDIVFSFGGIGATPDDHTRQAAADALGLPLVLHPQGKVNIQQRITEMGAEAGVPADLNSPENLHRLKMAEFVDGAELIPNPYNKIAGFAVREHYFVPGFPVMSWPMIEWVLDTHYPHLFNQVPHAEHALLVYETAESLLTPLMVRLEAEFPLIKVFSLPSVGDAQTRRHIELGVKGEPAQATAAFAQMCAALDTLQAEYTTI
ncbi:molybdopterin-binding protein [Janthinobacterium rivuli]|uniref:Molybdopterin-binding protein n=1 Tax=Janthinobacterium rivuli TaxID=2751478 RepID=A0ABY8I7H3_9BURK|nr:molybdopterin-binding protein [Janthinobacterium rivuli]WFR80820.1 molybdopterin-binding protein [Janthinobacterium rivuli]